MVFYVFDSCSTIDNIRYGFDLDRSISGIANEISSIHGCSRY